MTARTLWADLKQAGIPYRDEDGRVADFHALRHTFITNLARGGVHPKIAQALARHSTTTLTMDRYTHTVIGEQAEALRVRPDLPDSGENRTVLWATGTCDGCSDSTPDSTGNSTNLGSPRKPHHSPRGM